MGETRSTNNSDNLTVGSSKIFVGAYGASKSDCRDVGLTEGGISYNMTNEYYEANADQYKGIIDIRHIGRRMELSFTMKENLLENLQLAWDLADDDLDVDNGELSIGDNAGDYRCIYIEGPAPGGGVANWEFWKVGAITASEINQPKDSEALMEVTIVLIQDTSKPKKQCYGKRYDVYDDTTAPTVSSVTPADDSSGTSTSSDISWTFDEPIQEMDINNGNFNVIDDSGNEVNGSLSYDRSTNKVTLSPSSNLTSATTYHAFVSGEVRDLAGNRLGNNHRTTFST